MAALSFQLSLGLVLIAACSPPSHLPESAAPAAGSVVVLPTPLPRPVSPDPQPSASSSIGLSPLEVRTHEPSAPAAAARNLAGCDQGSASDCHAAALDAYYSARSPATDQAAFDLFSKGCQLDYAPSCNGLGVLYAEGRGVSQDESKAVDLYRSACEHGASTACEHLADAETSGRGTPKDQAAAKRATARGRCVFEASLHDKGFARCPAP